MDINATKETLNVNKIVCEKKELISVQGDMIVPDSKPDILSTINTSGNVCIYKKETLDGKVRIDGSILTYIMYLAEGENDSIRGLNTNLDFSEIINMPEVTTGMNIDVGIMVKFIECKVLNGRKIALNASIEANIKAYANETVDIITNINDENIQVLNKNMKVNSLLGDGCTKASVKENITIPNTDNLVEILKSQITLVDKDIKISYNKILAKSEVEINLAYLTEDGRIESIRTRLPLVGFIDMPNVKEENICETMYMIKNIIIKANSVEEHSIYVEMEIEISCMVYEEKDIQLIQDMYCPGEKMEFNKNMVNTMTNKQCKKSNCNINEKISVDELENGNIIDVEITPIINRESKLNEKVTYEGELQLNFIFTDNSSVGVNTKQVTIPFEHTIDGIENAENCKIETNIDVNSQEFNNQSGNISANVDLVIETNIVGNSAIPVINDISMEKQEDLEDYSVVIYVVKSGDTLWKIAKRFGSTVDDIDRVNGMENPNKINIVEKIYIPKYVLKKAKEPIVLKQNV